MENTANKSTTSKTNQNRQTFLMSVGILGLVLIAFLGVSIKVDFTLYDYMFVTGSGVITSFLFCIYYYKF